jgi:CDP-6-deoxy-D-xylo-4-hexulose-3-dehydrase
MHLEKKRIQTRPLFTGNITKQPGFKNTPFRIAGKTPHADNIHTNTFFIGIYPGITNAHIDYVTSVFHTYLKGKS